ncbi:probable phosphoglycerate mutase [Arboricoccus pini]|uniref:Probable phosphoglycerate mutase n=1 Tax=Arboricoccus pini TaxID=1963835 RepID=A0A212Q191_9PROT|nr:histidine phosphatase family protein [Arboricoccus pini]SNB53105.1 probable phosphoglycerate mutase [Arboricoccus pini]
MSTCLFIRHAPTFWNETGRIQGQSDVPLSPAGREQAAAWRLPARYAGAACLCSPLNRAMETARLIGFPTPATDPRLREMCWGSFEGFTLDELRASMGRRFQALEARGLDFRPPGGESPREVTVRLQAVLQELAARDISQVVVAHKGILRALVVLATGWPMLGKPPLAPTRDEALELELDETGRPERLRLVGLRRADRSCAF